MRALFCLIAITLVVNAFAQGAVPCDVHGCTYESATETTTITFSGTSYTPKCVRVASGTDVSFSGTFSSHPLVSGTFNDGTETPFEGTISLTNTGRNAEFNMTIDGPNPFYCDVHKFNGMVGVIYVGDSCAVPAAPTAPVAAPSAAPTTAAPAAGPVNAPSATPSKTPIKASSAIAVQVGALSLMAVLAL